MPNSVIKQSAEYMKGWQAAMESAMSLVECARGTYVKDKLYEHVDACDCVYAGIEASSTLGDEK